MRYLIPVLFVVISCETRLNKQPINDPEIGPAFYMSAFEEVEAQYQESPTDQLLKQKLYYLEMMEWPPISLSTLQEAKEAWGLNDDLVGKYTDFYLNNGHFAELRDLLIIWGKLHKLNEKLQEGNIIAHQELSQRNTTLNLLSDYIYDFHGPENQEFVARQYLKMGDTLMSIYHFSRLFNLEPSRASLVDEYVPLLLKVNHPKRAKEILVNSSKTDTTTHTQLMLAKSLYQLGERTSAKKILRDKNNSNTLELLTQWFWEEKQWDSATVYIDELIARDSSRHFIFMKASIMEERGLLIGSLDYFNHLVQTDSSDIIAKERAEEVGRKIAYLRELRESRKDTTVLKLTPKRLLDNE